MFPPGIGSVACSPGEVLIPLTSDLGTSDKGRIETNPVDKPGDDKPGDDRTYSNCYGSHRWVTGDQTGVDPRQDRLVSSVV